MCIDVYWKYCVVAAEPTDKSVEIMRKFSEQYARKSGTYFCVDKGVTSVVIKVYIDLVLQFNTFLLSFFLSPFISLGKLNHGI